MGEESPEVPVGKKIQAGRKSKGLTQEGLAREAGIPYTTLTKIESGVIKNPSLEAVAKLAKVLELSLDGLAMVQTYQGSEALPRIWEDALESMADGETMYLCGIAEQEFLDSDRDGLMQFIKSLRDRGLKQRILIRDKDEVRLEEPHVHYRSIPEEYFTSSPFYLYGDTVAFLIWRPTQQAVLVKSKPVSDAFKKLFSFMWDNAKDCSG